MLSPNLNLDLDTLMKLSWSDTQVGKWVVVFIVQDNESGIHTVTVEDTLHSFVQTENFTDGLSNVPIHGNIRY